jgi:hypothetical protein
VIPVTPGKRAVQYLAVQMQTRLLTDTAYALRPVNTGPTTSIGSANVQFTLVPAPGGYKTFPCRLRLPRQARNEEFAGKKTQPLYDAEIILPADSQVTQYERLRVNDVDYLITGSDPGRTDAIFITVKAERRKA